METLKKRLLSATESHKKMALDAVIAMFAHEEKHEVIKALCELREEGWINMKTRERKEGKGRFSCSVQSHFIIRSEKQLYTQKSLF